MSTMTDELVDLEQLFDESVPCAHGECETPAQWRGMMACCAASALICTAHKIRYMRRWHEVVVFSSANGNGWSCPHCSAKNPAPPIWTPL